MPVSEEPEEGVTPEPDQETPPETTGTEEPGTKPEEPAESETPEAAEEDTPTEETEEDPPDENPEGEKPEEDHPLHKALKAERQTVKDLKAANADLVKTNAELLGRLEAMEAAELERKTGELVTAHGLTEDQTNAIKALDTFDQRQAMAKVMNDKAPFARIISTAGGVTTESLGSFRTIAGKATKVSDYEAAIKASGCDPNVAAKIRSDIEKDRTRRMRFNDMDEEDQANYVIKQAIQKGLHLAGKKTSPAY